MRHIKYTEVRITPREGETINEEKARSLIKETKRIFDIFVAIVSTQKRPATKNKQK